VTSQVNPVSFAIAALLAVATLAAEAKPPVSRAIRTSGRKLTASMNCKSCHIIEGDGGLIGPPLDGIGQYRTEEQILRRLSSGKGKSKLPSYFTVAELMTHVRLPQPQAQAIAIYLAKLPECTVKWDLEGHGAAAADEIPPGFHFKPRQSDVTSDKGKELYLTHGCAACHTIGSSGGRMGPNLEGVGARYSRNFIESRISSGAIYAAARKGKYSPNKFAMPPAEIPEKEVKQITDFLLTLPVKAAAK
jgi:cytochrome c2